MNEYRVVLMDLPTTVHGFVIGKDEPTIILNSRLTHEFNQETWKHELIHIDDDAFEHFSVQIAEYIARRRGK